VKFEAAIRRSVSHRVDVSEPVVLKIVKMNYFEGTNDRALHASDCPSATCGHAQHDTNARDEPKKTLPFPGPSEPAVRYCGDDGKRAIRDYVEHIIPARLIVMSVIGL
jgi:hypothetical protein